MAPNSRAGRPAGRWLPADLVGQGQRQDGVQAGLLEQVRPGDTVVVWRLDRLWRSLRRLIDVVQDLQQREVAFLRLTEQIDTSTPGGRLIFHVFGALAGFERDLIRERTLAGLAAARARGRTGGRPTAWTPEKLRTAHTMRESGEYDVAGIARVLGVSRASVYRALDLPLAGAA